MFEFAHRESLTVTGSLTPPDSTIVDGNSKERDATTRGMRHLACPESS
jgi:hypothetical protein